MFSRLADTIVRWSGSVQAILFSVVVVAIWAAFGPAFHWSEGHQLVVNTGTTIVSFWLGFLILHAQQRDTLALQVKLDELILATTNARNELIGIEQRTEAEIEEVRINTENGRSS